jgi:hypothetical protein
MVAFCVTHPGSVATFDGESVNYRRVYIVRSERKFSFYSQNGWIKQGKCQFSLHKLPVYCALRFIYNE